MKIITSVVNNPIFIQIQHQTLKKYFKGDYEFIVFNDAKDFPDFTNGNDPTIKNQIEFMCLTLKIQCINIPNDHHKESLNVATRCADSMNFILDYQKKNVDEYLLIDSDIFLMNHFDIEKYRKYDCAIVLQTRLENKIRYFWNGIYYFNMKKLTNTELMNWDTCDHCDVGGSMQEWLKKQCSDFPSVETIRWENNIFENKNVLFLRHLWSCSWNTSEIPNHCMQNLALIEFLKKDSRNQNGKFFCEIYDDVFLHYRAGGNWRQEGVNTHFEAAKQLRDIL